MDKIEFERETSVLSNRVSLRTDFRLFLLFFLVWVFLQISLVSQRLTFPFLVLLLFSFYIYKTRARINFY
jgi:hypothetical protein